jgi:hypothetical protein
MIEIVVGLAMGVAAGAAASLYMARRHRDAAAEPKFEAWAKEGALVAALRCRREPGAGEVEHGQAGRAARELETKLGSHLARCERGRYPWTRYELALDIQAPSRRVVTVRLRGARRKRVEVRSHDLGDAIREVVRACPYVEAVWLHGQLEQGDLARAKEPDRDRLGWQGARDAEGELALRVMIGRPTWLSEVASDAGPSPPRLTEREERTPGRRSA